MIFKSITLTHLTEEDAQAYFDELHLLLDAYRKVSKNTDKLPQVKQHLQELTAVLKIINKK